MKVYRVNGNIEEDERTIGVAKYEFVSEFMKERELEGKENIIKFCIIITGHRL